MRFSSSFLVAFGLAALALGRPRPAAAVERFPPEITAHLSLRYVPPCRLCHIQGTTGAGSVQTPFGVSMKSKGLTTDSASLTAALDALRADGTDSDGDGVSDIDELEANPNTDPNTPVDVPLTIEGPTYGCAVGGRRGGSSSAASLAALVAAFGLALVRRRGGFPRGSCRAARRTRRPAGRARG